MSAHEFILVQVERILVREGFSKTNSERCAQSALDYYKSSSGFKKTAIEDCIKHARKMAKASEPRVRK